MRKFINSYSVSFVVIVIGIIFTYVALEHYYGNNVQHSMNGMMFNSHDYKAAWCGVTLIIAGLITLTINDIFKKP